MRALRMSLLLLVALGMSACYRDYVVTPTCRAVWVPGHYGPWGRWHPAHWRCV